RLCRLASRARPELRRPLRGVRHADRARDRLRRAGDRLDRPRRVPRRGARAGPDQLRGYGGLRPVPRTQGEGAVMLTILSGLFLVIGVALMLLAAIGLIRLS